MTEHELNKLVKGFLEGELSDSERKKLRKEFDSYSETNSSLSDYFEFVKRSKEKDATIISKSEFFNDLDKRNVFQRQMMIAATISLVLLFSVIMLFTEFSLSDNQIQTKKEVDESLKITYQALTSFSNYYEKGIQNLSNGMDLSKPFDPLSNYKSIETN